MAEMLLINPRRRKARRNPAKRSAAQRAATRKLVAMNRARSNPRRRRRNPAPAAAATMMATNPRRRRRMARRSNPIRMIRRRRNPAMLGGFSFRAVVGAMQDALIQGGGAIAIDLLHGQIKRFLPAMLQRTPGKLGLGDVVYASLTVLVGHVLNKPTRGLSMKAATGSLTVQAYQIVQDLLPSTMQVGYYAPGQIVQGNARVGPTRAVTGSIGRYTGAGAPTPLLNRYTTPGATALLNGAGRARMREGVTIR